MTMLSIGFTDCDNSTATFGLTELLTSWYNDNVAD